MIKRKRRKGSGRHLREGFTLVETVIVLAVLGLIIVPTGVIVSQLVLFPGERSDIITLTHSVRQATRWISLDARQASSFAAGTSPDYGTFTWTDRTGATPTTHTVRYYYDSSTASIMREEDTGSGPTAAVVSTYVAAYADASIEESGGVVSASVTATKESTSGPVTKNAAVETMMRPMARTPGATPPPTTVAWDDFESGGWTGGSGWLFEWFNQGDSAVVSDGGAYQGAYHLRLRRGTGYVDRALDLSGLSNVRLQFWAKADSFEPGETATASVSPDGTTWTVVRTWVDGQDDNVYHFEDVDLSSFTMSSEFWIAFDAQMSGTDDSFWVDQIKVVRTW